MFAVTVLSIPVVLPAAAADHDQPALQLAQAGARGLSFDNYIRLKKGISEGELLSRAGTPDHQTIDAVSDRGDAVEIARTYYYYATAEDPFITTIKVLGGTVVDIKRERQF
jgi:hypothetical protein